MGTEATAVSTSAPAAVAPAAVPAATTVALAPGATTVAPAAAAPATVAPVVVAATAESIATAEAAHTAAVAAAQGKAADSVEGKAAATAKAALDALKPAPAAVVAAKKAPESYTDFTQPQGTKFQKTVIDALKGVGKELDLSQADMQKLIDKVAPAFVTSEKANIGEFVNKIADQWRAEVLADPELGGETSPAKIAVAKKTFDVFGTPKLQALLSNTGLGDHPELLRWAHRIGSAIGPDNKFVAGTTLTKANVAPEERLWPTK